MDFGTQGGQIRAKGARHRRRGGPRQVHPLGHAPVCAERQLGTAHRVGLRLRPKAWKQKSQRMLRHAKAHFALWRV